MSRAPVRRSHMVSPFGPGALLVAPDGTSMIAAGLDFWFDGGEDGRNQDEDEFRIEEWRLQRRLGVDHLRLPPDYRRPRRGQGAVPNVGMSIPFLRFPRWHFCWRCKRLTQLTLAAVGRQRCQPCSAEGKTAFLAQVPFVAMCEDGHLQDFPWREWVHRSAFPVCRGDLRLYATGGATLANQVVKCDCKKTRSLSGIVEASTDGANSTLSSSLEPGAPFLCRGNAPHHGSSDEKPCQRPLRGSLRSASNLYFGVVRSAIYLPRAQSGALSELVHLLLGEEDLIGRIVNYGDAGQRVDPVKLRRGYAKKLQAYTDDELEKAADAAYTAVDESQEVQPESEDASAEGEQAFRRAEAGVLAAAITTEELTVVPVDPASYAGVASTAFSVINLVERLRETRALAGFDRVLPEQETTYAHRMAQLWRKVPPPSKTWLPAYLVYGEGLFFSFDEDALQKWETRPEVLKRVDVLTRAYASAQQRRRLRDRDFKARFLLVHSFAHLLMNQLTFDCGYSSAALRERLYVSDDPSDRQASVLIYTAAGDAEGTMGGLVRMGKPGYLENVLAAALSGATWCGSDPICMEIGSTTGQGPDACNLAACHSCGLVPETACEEFNRFLDRGVVVGTIENPDLGFFPGLGWSP